MTTSSLPLLESNHMLNGIVAPNFITQSTLDKIKDLQLRPDDVWIVTYPKAGTTWTQQIVRLLRSKSDTDRATNVTDAVPWLEAFPRYPNVNYEDVKKDPRPRAFKSHMPYELMPCGLPHTTPCKYIYVARNPKDVAVSLYFQYRGIFAKGLTWEKFWAYYTTGNVHYDDFFEHVLSWWPHRDDENVLFLKYEDMKKNLPAAVASIASFIGCDASEEVIDEVVSKTTFETMKDDSTANYSWHEKIRDPNEPPFMRKGVVGDWTNHLTPEQSKEIDTMCERLKKVGLEFDFV